MWITFLDNLIRDAGATNLATLLERNSSLQTLNLSGTWFLSIRLVHSAHVFFFLANGVGHAGATVLATALKRNWLLHKFDSLWYVIFFDGRFIWITFLDNLIRDAGAMALATVLERNSSLQTLNIGCTWFYFDLFGWFCSCLFRESHWRCWSDCFCNSLEAKLVTACFKSQRYVIYFDSFGSFCSCLFRESDWSCWSDCSCNSLGAKLVAADFESRKCVNYIWFVWVILLNVSLVNKIGAAGTIAFATVFERNSSLQTLKLSRRSLILIGWFMLVQYLHLRYEICRSDYSCKRVSILWHSYIWVFAM